jgi:FAD/FMN-containing dehydrogenase
LATELKPSRIVVKDSGVWGIPELFSIRLEHLAPGTEQADSELEAAMDLGLRIAQDLGGSMEYCHGVGLRLAHLMGDELGSGLEALRRMKRALDPDGLLNPGKLAL